MADPLDKHYSHQAVESRWYPFWLERGLFRAADADPGREPYCIVIPPPNITGSLHMGHALTLTIQDVLIRWRRMQGRNALWLPGTDHAGIATQMVVEKELARSGLSRHALGREAFLEKVWEWKARHGSRINEQTRRMGASLDWERERFTLDEGLSRAVREVFVRLYEEGLIYRDNRLINWCPRCLTALSDLEVEHRENLPGEMWSFAYPLADGAGEIVVATTRPETMLGDTAVAVHPDDPRYRGLVGRHVRHPLLGYTFPIVADADLVDMAFGTGAVKVTPAHDPNDFETGKRHGLEFINILDPDGRLNDRCGPFAGLDRFEGRAKVKQELERLGLFRGRRDHTMNIGACQRCQTIVEPYLSPQWFVRIRPLADEAVRAVREGRTAFVPAMWEKTYYEWMDNIRDWCISRQLWWGHQIPAWHCRDCGGVTVARETPSACSACGSGALGQDQDVLDTWFSSALWPFSTLGWPEETPALRTFYPTAVMETGFDIIFFWVARMMMMGLKFMGEVPFRTVYLHAMVRDEKGEKMSKTRGNVIDPLDVVERHGADALRFTLASMAGQGQDIKLSLDRVAGYAAFINKVWNASRFVLMNLDGYRPGPLPPPERLSPADAWILDRLDRTCGQVGLALERFEFDQAAHHAYQFTWRSFCDWYIELAKPALYGRLSPEARQAAQAVLVHVLDRVVRLLHPFMPFATEEIWQKLPGRPEGSADSIVTAPYPVPEPGRLADEAACDGIEFVMELIAAVRAIRGENRIEPSVRLPLALNIPDPKLRELARKYRIYLEELARTGEISWEVEPAGPAARTLVRGATLAVPLTGLVDLAGELARLRKEQARLEKDVAFLAGKLGNPGFLSKAAPEMVERERARHAEAAGKLADVMASIDRLSGQG